VTKIAILDDYIGQLGPSGGRTNSAAATTHSRLGRIVVSQVLPGTPAQVAPVRTKPSA
jgi:hypothetical protein